MRSLVFSAKNVLELTYFKISGLCFMVRTVHRLHQRWTLFETVFA